MEEETTSPSINSLPDEILIMILSYTSYTDCNSFRRTCKQYSELVGSSNSLWKVFYRNAVDAVIYTNTSPGDWQCKLKDYLTLKNLLIQMIINMFPKCTREFTEEILLDDVKKFFDIALTSNTTYYCVISILQGFIQTALKKINTYNTEKPYTLTEINYSKCVLQHLFHMIFTLKWTQYKITNQLPPHIVLNFFTQWNDPAKMHRDEEVTSLISDMIKDVDKNLLLEKKNESRLPGEDTKNTCTRGFYSERQVITAISHYMYKERRMLVTDVFNQDTLCLVKTIKSNTGTTACLGAIFEAIAKGFGIKSCRLITFPNHMFLKWWPDDTQYGSELSINLKTGELQRASRCPFSANPDPRDIVYSPELLIEYVTSHYMQAMGQYRNWHLNNAIQLLKFVTNSSSSYCDFGLVHKYLRGCDREKILLPFNLENVHQEHLKFVSDLVNLCLIKIPPRPKFHSPVKTRSGALKYCIGMICYHKEYEYMCVIRAWDLQYSPERRSDQMLQQDIVSQPFYYVTAVDQSNRYISQSNLEAVPNPSRIFHLEDIISNEFTHFNGFFYEPNEEKQFYYPEDMAVGMVYAAKRFNSRVPVNDYDPKQEQEERNAPWNMIISGHR